jgi:hypothetical protein
MAKERGGKYGMPFDMMDCPERELGKVGNVMEGYGDTVLDRPDFKEVLPGYCFMAINDGIVNGVDTRQVWQATTTGWKEL